MKKTLTVKDLIIQLLEFSMNEPVFIALGSSTMRPNGSSALLRATLHNSSATCEADFGVYIHPADTLVDTDDGVL